MQYKIKKPIRLIELFGGIGSQAMALRDLNTNFEHYKLIEFDEKPIKSYNVIHNTNFKPIDITKIQGKDLEIVDTDKYEYIMTYSFPCTSLSLVGKQEGMTKGSGTSSSLLWEVERLLNEVENLPQILVMENVKQVLSPKHIDNFKLWMKFLSDKGYSNFYQILDSKDYNIPQHRERCIMVSILGDYTYKFPEKIPFNNSIKNYLLEDKDINIKYLLKRKDIKKQRFVKQAYETLKKENPTFGDTINAFNQTVNKSNISPTITTRPEGFKTAIVIVMENGDLRKITPKECWNLMGFSDKDFYNAKKVCTDSQLYKQAGNSIVKQVLMNVFKELL